MRTQKYQGGPLDALASLSYLRRDVITVVTQIEDGILKLEMFKTRAAEALPVIDSILGELEQDGAVGERDAFRHGLLVSLRNHLVQLHKIEEAQSP